MEKYISKKKIYFQYRRMVMEAVKLGLVQMFADFDQPEKNFCTIKKYITLGAEQGIEILCFPEMALHGYCGNIAPTNVEKIKGNFTKEILDLAKHNKMIIVVGLAEDNGSNNPFITQFIAFPEGTYACYRKTHLGQSEQGIYSANDDIAVFKCPKVNFAIQLCWEAHFPELSTIQGLKGAELIFVPHASPLEINRRKTIWLKYLQARAYDNSIYVAACNLLKKDKNKSKGGGLLVIDPKGNIVAEYFEAQEKLMAIDITGELVNSLRLFTQNSMGYKYPLNMRRPELYGELCKKNNNF